MNGVVGFKPTHGLVSGHGIIPLAASQDTAGPITGNVDDAIAALAAIIDPDAERADEVITALSALPVRDNLEGMNVGVIALTRGFDKRRDALLDDALDITQQFRLVDTDQ